MTIKHVFFISPPFYSHFNPLLVLAKSFRKHGVQVTFACSREFKEKVMDQGLNFYEIDISNNRNMGTSDETSQPDSEKMRLEEFFEATKEGAIETLITQSRHRKDDMLYQPEELIKTIGQANDLFDIDLFVIDILSYAVTLSLYFLNLPFITFCPPHPNTIPQPGQSYGIPQYWPTVFEIKDQDLRSLKEIAGKTESDFTRVFNQIISNNKGLKKTDNAFALVSEIAIIYNYFDFYRREKKNAQPKQLFMGNCFEQKALDQEWLEKVATNEKKIMITLGTFLANRKDVLEKLICFTREIFPQALLIVAAGSNAKSLKKLGGANTIIEDFIPQIGLMPYVDRVIFHGGCNTFTEAMYYQKDLIVLPFSSDQFNIAYDIEKNKLGGVLDPNHFTKDDLLKAFNQETSEASLRAWSEVSRERGADYAVKRLLD